MTLYDLEIVPESVRETAYHMIKMRLEPIIVPEESVIELADMLIDWRVFAWQKEDFALHVAIAAASGMDALVSWDYRNIVNAECRRGVAFVCDLFGVKKLELVTPEDPMREN